MASLTRTLLALSLLTNSVSLLQYDVGVEYEYEYKTTLKLTEPFAKASEVAFQLSSHVTITSVWKNANQQLLMLKMSPQLMVKTKGKDYLEGHSSSLDSLPVYPVLFLLDRGRIVNLYASVDENEDLLNLKRGVASLFQLQQVTGHIEETDASGSCQVNYKISGRTTTKTKKSCNLKAAKEFSHSNKVYATTLKNTQETIYQLSADDFVIDSVENNERFQYQVQSLQNTAAAVISKQKLILLKQIQGKDSFTGNDVKDIIATVSKIFNIKFAPTSIILSDKNRHYKPVSKIINDRKELLLNKRLARVKSTEAFLQILRQFRLAKKDHILEVYRDPKNKNILAPLLELAAAAQTPAAFESAIEILPNIHSSDIVERFLHSLAVTNRPTEATILTLKSTIENEIFKEFKVKQTAILVLSALLRTFSHSVSNHHQSLVVDQVIHYLTSELNECSDDTCHLTYIRALSNAAQPKTIPVLINHVKKGGKVATMALQALKSFPSESIGVDVKEAMMEVCNQVRRRYDSTSRLYAIDVILQNNPSEQDLKSIVKILFDLNEMSTYLLARLKESVNNDYELRSLLIKILSEPRINNYDIMSQSGISTAFTYLLTGDSKTNATYGVHMELAKGGLLKQSVFDVKINTELDTIHVLAFGMFASGLSGLAGDISEDAAEEDEGDATAGIELGLFGVNLRPYVFFVGQADLMSHVWSGTASEPTAILQGNLLLHDDEKYIATGSGFILNFRANGLLSMDMTGSLQASLWNRNSHSEISTKSALYIRGSASLSSEFIEAMVEMTLSSENKLQFITDSEFYEAPFKMCTQMLQPKFPVRFVVRKIERIPQGRHRIQKKKSRLFSVPGKCFALHPKNTALCGVMLK